MLPTKPESCRSWELRAEEAEAKLAAMGKKLEEARANLKKFQDMAVKSCRELTPNGAKCIRPQEENMIKAVLALPAVIEQTSAEWHNFCDAKYELRKALSPGSEKPAPKEAK